MGTISDNKKYYFSAALLLFAAIIIRFNQLGLDELWIDEAFTGFMALGGDWLSYLTSDNTPPVYYLLQRLWCAPLSCNEFFLRTPSVLYGLLFIVVIVWLVRLCTNRFVSLLLTSIIIVSPLHIYYSQEARAYSLMLLAIGIFYLVQHQFLARNTKKNACLLLLACLGLLFTHYLTVIVVATCLAMFFIEKLFFKRAVPGSYFLLVSIPLGLFLVWLFFYVLGHSGTSDEMHWIADYFDKNPAYRFIDQSLLVFLSGPVRSEGFALGLILKRYPDIALPGYYAALQATMLTLYFALLAALFLQTKRMAPEEKVRLFEFSMFCFLPLLGLLFISIFIKPVYVVGRYDLIAYPGFCLLTGFILYLLTRYNMFINRPITVALMTVFILGLLFMQSTKQFHYWIQPADNKSMSKTLAIEERIDNDDTLVLSSHDAIVNVYYLMQAGYHFENNRMTGPDKSFALHLYPSVMEQAPASTQRFALANTVLDPLLFSIVPENDVWLHAEDLHFANNQLTIDPVSLQFFNGLLQTGWAIGEISAGINLIQLTKPAG